jgi:hypothetical protein
LSLLGPLGLSHLLVLLGLALTRLGWHFAASPRPEDPGDEYEDEPGEDTDGFVSHHPAHDPRGEPQPADDLENPTHCCHAAIQPRPAIQSVMAIRNRHAASESNTSA